ncbi:MAG: DUF839 domain-containing protein [Alphaproteobacteria bacterium]|nr:DUF839 domain-containing protein [Alphaproteobacteria bacterium]
MATDPATAARGFANGLWARELAGPRRAVTRYLLWAPALAEVRGPWFSPDDTTLFVSIQHSGADFLRHDLCPARNPLARFCAWTPASFGGGRDHQGRWWPERWPRGAGVTIRPACAPRSRRTPRPR